MHDHVLVLVLVLGTRLAKLLLLTLLGLRKPVSAWLGLRIGIWLRLRLVWVHLNLLLVVTDCTSQKLSCRPSDRTEAALL